MIINEISTKPCYIEIYCNSILISKATGFQIHHGHKYLITNWHVVSGRNFITNECLDANCAIPDKLIVTYKKYVDGDYPKYETFNAIDVGNLNDIPYDYYGIMGVPKTFLDCYNPEQFEILGYEREDENIQVGIKNMPEKFLQVYREQGGTGHYTKGMKMLCYYDKNKKAKIPFSRILIRRKSK